MRVAISNQQPAISDQRSAISPSVFVMADYWLLTADCRRIAG